MGLKAVVHMAKAQVPCAGKHLGVYVTWRVLLHPLEIAELLAHKEHAEAAFHFHDDGVLTGWGEDLDGADAGGDAGQMGIVPDQGEDPLHGGMDQDLKVHPVMGTLAGHFPFEDFAPGGQPHEQQEAKKRP